MPKPYFFYANGMTCSSCSNTIESFLRNNNHGFTIKTFSVDLSTEEDPKKITITLDETAKADELYQQNWILIKNLIEDIGFSCEPYEYSPHKKNNIKKTRSLFKKITSTGYKIITSHWFLGALGCAAGITLLAVSLALGGLPLAALIPVAGISILLTLALGARSYIDAWKKLTVSQSLTMDSLFALSTLSVIAVSIAAFFVPWLPMMFEAGLLIFGFRHIGIAIEKTIKGKISSGRFQDRAPKKVRKQISDTTEDTELEHIQPEDIILINPGELIPLDGFCLNDSLIFRTIISGETLPRHFRPEDKVLAGMRLADAAQPLKIRVSKTAQHSYLARLDAGIAQSITEKAPLEEKTTRLLSYFIPAVIGVSIISGIIIGLLFSPALAIQCAISVLVSACPCTLGLIIPLAVKTGIHKAAEHGVQFKNSKVLQEAEQIDTVVFDLNGTLTTGVPIIEHYALLEDSGLSPNQFLSLCASLEEHSAHPIGKAIYNFAQQNSTQTLKASEIDNHNHSGVTGLIDGEKYLIGSSNLMHAHKIATATIEQKLNLKAGDNLIFLARDNKLLGYIISTDPLRKDAFETINALIKMNKEVHICTGSDEKTAARYAQALGIKKIQANCVPTATEKGDKAKSDYINSLKQAGHKVAMIGDAANDANAIVASDFSIAMLSPNSDELTQEYAGAIIQNSSLLPIANAFAISKQTVSNIKQNLIMSLTYNLAAVLIAGGLLVAIGFVLNPAIGVALMVFQACFILLNVYRFKQQTLEHLEHTEEHSITKNEVMSSSHQVITQHTPKRQINPEQEANDAEKTTAPKKASSPFWEPFSSPASDNTTQYSSEAARP